eukprot:3076358-Pyramimonas_sp.AAC.1
MEDLRDWAHRWHSDLAQRATYSTEWRDWRVAFMTDLILSGADEAKSRLLIDGPPRHAVAD